MSESKPILGVLGDDDPSVISIRQVLSAIMRELGGPEGFAKIVADDFVAADPGSPQRVQLDGKIIQALQNFGVEDSPESASEDELLAQVRSIVNDDPSLVEKAAEGGADGS